MWGCQQPEHSATKTGDPIADTAAHTQLTTVTTYTGEAGTSPWLLDVDCSQLLPLPLSYTTVTWVPSHEDWTFSVDGGLIGVGTGAVKSTPYGGPTQVLLPGVDDARGTRFLPDRTLVVADMSTQAIKHIDLNTGSQQVVRQLVNPNGVAIGADGWVYVTVTEGVVRVDPSTGDMDVLANIQGKSFDGISFSPDYTRLYFNEELGDIWYIDFDADNQPGSPTKGPNIPLSPFGILDGMTVDACGNLYAVEMNHGVWRVTPDGDVALAVDVTGFAFMSSLNFGIDAGGWDPTTLYIMDFAGKLYEAPVGVPGKWEPHHIVTP